MKNSGFTLLELIIVILLMSVALSMSAVFFANTLPSSRFNSTVREFVASIRQARYLAQSSGERQTITIDLDARNYGIEGRGTRTLPPNVKIKVEDPFYGELTTGKYPLVFFEIGGAEGGAVVLWDEKRTARIDIDPVIGAAVVK